MADSRRAWARALFAAGLTPATRQCYAKALSGIGRALSSSGDFRDGLEDPSLPKAQRVGLIEAALPAGCDAEGRKTFGRFARLLVDKGRVGLLPAIAVTFGELADAEGGIARLDIEAAREPDEKMIASLATAWGAAGRGEEVIVRLRLLPNLIGGFRLRSGSIRYDYSIAGRVERLRRHLSQPLGQARDKG